MPPLKSSTLDQVEELLDYFEMRPLVPPWKCSCKHWASYEALAPKKGHHPACIWSKVPAIIEIFRELLEYADEADASLQS